MKRLSLIPPVLLLCLFVACEEESSPVAGGRETYADQQYYPIEQGTFWRYRMDTTGISGTTVRDAYRIISRIGGKVQVDSLIYTVQVNEIDAGLTTTFDTLFIRKDAGGIFLSSPQLRNFSLIPGFPGIGLNFPKEFLVLPADPEFTSSWTLINFEFNQIPLLQIYFRVTATYLGKETVQTDFRTFKECVRIRVNIDAQYPNPENPQDIFNPIRIRENASFWLTRPFGLVVGDGNEAIFTMMSGRIPFSIPRKRLHQEVLGMEIVQPRDTCVVRK